MKTQPPATLTTTEKGSTLSIYKLRPGRYIWHKGAFRLVTEVDYRRCTPKVRMGRHVLNCVHADTVEVAP